MKMMSPSSFGERLLLKGTTPLSCQAQHLLGRCFHRPTEGQGTGVGGPSHPYRIINEDDDDDGILKTHLSLMTVGKKELRMR
jgi:hypothetical protein